MSISSIQKALLKNMPRFRANGPYIYESSYCHIVGGFLLERGSGGIYVWRFALPLYDGDLVPHLTYGERLSGSDGFIESSFLVDRPQVISRIRGIFERNEARVLESTTLGGFLSIISGSSAENLYCIFAASCTLFMLDDAVEAARLLEYLAKSDETLLYSGLSERVELLRSAALHGIDQARLILERWEEEAKQAWPRSAKL